MKTESKKIEKLCSFYVSQWHLTTMLLPYINLNLQKNAKIITILENSLQSNVETLVKKLNLKNEEEILSINWKNIKSIKYENIANKLKKEISKNTQNIILINGSKEYIEKNNYNIEKWFEKSCECTIKIINFFEVTEFNENIEEILNSHNKVFNTSGEREISEVFG